MEEIPTDTRTERELLLAILKNLEAIAQIVVEEHVAAYHPKEAHAAKKRGIARLIR